METTVLVASVMKRLEDRGADLSSFGSITCDEIAEEIRAEGVGDQVVIARLRKALEEIADPETPIQVNETGKPTWEIKDIARKALTESSIHIPVVGGRYRWLVEISVAEVWIEDGFDLSHEGHQQALIEGILDFADETEKSVRVIATPDPESIAQGQGYESVADREAKSRR